MAWNHDFTLLDNSARLAEALQISEIAEMLKVECFSVKNPYKRGMLRDTAINIAM